MLYRIVLLFFGFLAFALSANANDSSYEKNHKAVYGEIHTKSEIDQIMKEFAQSKVELKQLRKQRRKLKFKFTANDKVIIKQIKKLSTDSITELKTNLESNYTCIISPSTCINQDPGYVNARLRRLQKANNMYRRLVGAFVEAKKLYDYIDQTKDSAHFLYKKNRKKLGVSKIKFSDYETKYLRYILRTNDSQILRDWKRKNPNYRNEIPDIPLYNSQIPGQPKPNVTMDSRIRFDQGYKVFAGTQKKELQNLYFKQITNMITTEPILIFLSGRVVNKANLAKAFSKYIRFTENRIETIKKLRNKGDIIDLLVLFDSLPNKHERFNDTYNNQLINPDEWNDLIGRINLVKDNLSRLRTYFTLGLMGTAFYSFVKKSIPALGFALSAVWIVTTGADWYIASNKQNKAIINWVSGIETYNSLDQNRKEIKKHKYMIAFFGFAALPAIMRGKELLSLTADEVGTIIENLKNYSLARAKWKAKGSIGADGVNISEDIMTSYISYNEQIVTYIPTDVFNYNDLLFSRSNCVSSPTGACDYSQFYD